MLFNQVDELRQILEARKAIPFVYIPTNSKIMKLKKLNNKYRRTKLGESDSGSDNDKVTGLVTVTVKVTVTVPVTVTVTVTVRVVVKVTVTMRVVLDT